MPARRNSTLNADQRKVLAGGRLPTSGSLGQLLVYVTLLPGRSVVAAHAVHQKKAGSTDAVLGDAGAKRIAMHMLRDLAAEQLFTAFEEGLKKNHTPEQLAKLELQVKQLEGIFRAVKAAKSGDVILLDYLPGAGTRITVRGEDKGMIAGEEFSRALLRIWLGEQPADASLKKAMLGG